MYELEADNEKIAAELYDVVRLFYPDGNAPFISQHCDTGKKMKVRITV